MIEPSENYFIKSYEKALSIDEEISYIFDIKIDSKNIQSFSLYNPKCGEFFIQDTEYMFFKHIVGTQEGFTKINFALSEQEHHELIRTFMFNDILFLHYKQEIKIIHLLTNHTFTVSRAVEKLVVGSKGIYIYERDLHQVHQYFFDATQGEIFELDGVLVDMDYADDLYILTLEDETYQITKNKQKFSSTYLDTITSENMQITHFAMLQNNDFIIYSDNKELYYIDNTHNLKELFFDREIQMIETDCNGRVWILSEHKLFRFKRDIRYKTPKSFFVKFNSFKEDTLWHSLIIDADLPEGTRMEVLVDCDNRPTKRHMNTKKFEKQTQHYINTKEILFYKEQGKKLLIKVTLYSDSLQQSTPQVYAIKSIFDKTSYLNYLPEYYKEDSESLYRYLALFQNIMDEIEDTIEDMPKKLDLRTTDDQFLTWLSEWLGLVRDYRWPEKKWREFVMRAPELYKKMGTKEGLSEIIEIYSSHTPDIEEFHAKASHPFFFCVHIDADFSETQEAVIRAIVDMYKPAYTEAKVVLDQKTKDNKNLILNESVLAFSSVIN